MSDRPSIEPKLEEPSAQLLPVFGSADADPQRLQVPSHRRAGRPPPSRGELVQEPPPHWQVAVGILVELELVTVHGRISGPGPVTRRRS